MNIFVISFVLFFSCNTDCLQAKPPIKIAFSKCSGSDNYKNYVNWLKKIYPDFEVVDLFSLDRKTAMQQLRLCSGLVLTGGDDVNPDYYGKGTDSTRCELDPVRDTIEFAAIKIAKKLKMPIMAICRGEQILNVAFGGSLIIDISKDYGTQVKHRDCPDGACQHRIIINKKSRLFKITKTSDTIVNSFHHQAIDRLAKCFVVCARAEDGIVEAYEWKKQSRKPFFIAIQWHPERLEENHPMSSPIGNYYIKKVKAYKVRKNI